MLNTLKLFKNISEESFTLDDVYFHHDYGTTFVVKRPHKEYNYDKEMITLRF